MSRFETTFRTAIANAERDVLVDQIRANPQMSLSELGKLATGELGNLLKQITVADLLGAVSGGGGGGGIGGAGRGGRKGGAGEGRESGGQGRKGGGEGRESGGQGRKGGGGESGGAQGGARKQQKAAQAEVDTRTAEGRAAYDEAVLAALRAAGGPQSASELTAVAGGSPLQIRTALARLIETGTVNWSGRARGTRYTPA
ncbi:MAG TPA: hypothetical protein VGB85_28145 [Nannocystis sp.]